MTYNEWEIKMKKPRIPQNELVIMNILFFRQWIRNNVKKVLLAFSLRVQPKPSQVHNWLVTKLFDSSKEVLHKAQFSFCQNVALSLNLFFHHYEPKAGTDEVFWPCDLSFN